MAVAENLHQLVVVFLGVSGISSGRRMRLFADHERKARSELHPAYELRAGRSGAGQDQAPATINALRKMVLSYSSLLNQPLVDVFAAEDDTRIDSTLFSPADSL